MLNTWNALFHTILTTFLMSQVPELSPILRLMALCLERLSHHNYTLVNWLSWVFTQAIWPELLHNCYVIQCLLKKLKCLEPGGTLHLTWVVLHPRYKPEASGELARSTVTRVLSHGNKVGPGPAHLGTTWCPVCAARVEDNFLEMFSSAFNSPDNKMQNLPNATKSNYWRIWNKNLNVSSIMIAEYSLGHTNEQHFSVSWWILLFRVIHVIFRNYIRI